jgi:hypothetical protein
VRRDSRLLASLAFLIVGLALVAVQARALIDYADKRIAQPIQVDSDGKQISFCFDCPLSVVETLGWPTWIGVISIFVGLIVLLYAWLAPE